MIIDTIDDHTIDDHALGVHDPENINLWRRYYKSSDAFPTAKNFDVSFRWVLQKALEDSSHIDINYGVLGGTPRIADTRIPVYMILQAIEYHENLEGAIKAYPRLNMEQVRDAILFAAAVLECSVDGD